MPLAPMRSVREPRIDAQSVILIERQFHLRRRKPVPPGQRIKMFQALPLPRPEAELQVIAQVRKAIRLGNADSAGPRAGQSPPAA